MKKTLIIGSTALDIILEVDRLPGSTDDCHIRHQSMALGGCAYNVQNIIRHFKLPHLFCSPVGTGLYGNYIEDQLLVQGITPFVKIADQDNGCCYCYVEPHGERTFLSYHGAEYTFDKKWLKDITMDSYSFVYICGLEIEEPTGMAIIEFLEEHDRMEIFFAPGPRIDLIDEDKMTRLFQLSPIMHLSKGELMSYTGLDDLEQAAKVLQKQSKNTLLITDGAVGAYILEQDQIIHVEGESAQVVDTIGAGDAHIGAIIACRQLGYSYKKSVATANLISAGVVSSKGSTLSSESFLALDLI